MEAVIDQWGRPLQDLRISLTDRCNFRCVYCMPREIFGTAAHFLPDQALLTGQEIARLVKLFALSNNKAVYGGG